MTLSCWHRGFQICCKQYWYIANCCRATEEWYAAQRGVRTTQSVTSSHVDLIVRLLAGTSTSPLCYKKNEMLEEFLHFMLPWTSTLLQTSPNTGLLLSKSSSLHGDFSKCCSCYHVVHSLHELYRKCDFFKISSSRVWTFIFWHPLVNMFTVA